MRGIVKKEKKHKKISHKIDIRQTITCERNHIGDLWGMNKTWVMVINWYKYRPTRKKSILPEIKVEYYKEQFHSEELYAAHKAAMGRY